MSKKDLSDIGIPRMLIFDEIRKLVPFTREHIMVLEREGKFPMHVQLGARRIAWLEPEVKAWLDARIAERDAGSPSPLREKRRPTQFTSATAKAAPHGRRRAA